MRVMHKLAAEHEVTTQLDYNPRQKEKDGVLDVIDTLPRAPKCTTTSAMDELSGC